MNSSSATYSTESARMTRAPRPPTASGGGPAALIHPTGGGEVIVTEIRLRWNSVLRLVWQVFVVEALIGLLLGLIYALVLLVRLALNS